METETDTENGHDLPTVRTAITVTGASALGVMSDAEFTTRLDAMVKGRDRIQQIQRACMREGVHYGKIPGRENDKDAKPGLLKPGAEVLRGIHGLVPDFEHAIAYGDPHNVDSPAISVRTRCLMHTGSLEGPVVAVGYGAANSWEVKYRYRQAARACPKCTKTTIMRSKFENNRGPYAGTRPWWCNSKAGGCGEEFGQGDVRITEQVTGRIANDDALDLENTLLKMAEKRADVGTTIRATASSDLFTQDVEDVVEAGPTPKPAPTPTAERPPITPPQRKSEQATTAGAITKAQQTRLFTIAHKHGHDDGDMRAWLATDYGVEHTGDILQRDYDAICARLEQAEPLNPQAEHDAEPGSGG